MPKDEVETPESINILVADGQRAITNEPQEVHTCMNTMAKEPTKAKRTGFQREII